MTSKRRFARRSAEPLEPVATEPPVPFDPSPGGDIPPHVWSLLQQAGEAAAGRLRDLLKSPDFASYAPTAKARLIELALVRAYGLPIRRAVTVNLSGDDVAKSLAELSDMLPERQATGRGQTIDGSAHPAGDMAAQRPAPPLYERQAKSAAS